jgi:two-component system, sensor histidine kinase YesM
LYRRRLWNRRLSFSTILWCSLVFMLIVPGIANLVIFVTQMNQVLSSNITTNSLEMLEQTSNAAESEMKNILFTIGSIAYDNQIITNASMIRSHALEMKSSGTEMNLLDGYLRKYFHYNTYPLQSVIFFYNDQGMYVNNYQDRKDLVITEEQLRNMPWFKRLKNGNNEVQMLGMEENEAVFRDGRSYITFFVVPKSTKFYYGVEAIYFIFDASLLNEKLRSQVTKVGDLYILDADGAVIANRQAVTKDKPSILQHTMERDRGFFIRDQQLVVYITSERGWKYCLVLPYHTISESTNKILLKIVVIGAGSLLLFLLICIFLIRSINRPVLRLVNHMNMVKRGDLSTTINESGPLEIYMLGSTFNLMVKQIRDLLHDVEEKEKQRTQAEIDALQSQINPHFLLNTLNNIKVMAAVSKVDNIKQMTESLTKLLGASFYRKGTHAKIVEEIELIQNYVYIMKVRFGDSFDFIIDIDSDVQHLYILKLLIQPLVENAIIHGLYEVESRGEIRIEARRSERSIQFQIIDNGKGMDTETLLRLQRSMNERHNHFNGIGIKNVMQRIELNYGREYGISILSTPSEGTNIKMIVPILEDE